MRAALIFPGQGSKGVIEAVDFASGSDVGRALLARAADAAGETIASLTSRGGRVLEATRVLQPVLTAIALSAHAHLAAAGVSVDVVAGHSLGEIAAWSAAGCVSPEDAIAVAAERGRLMEREAARCPGGLVALLDATDASVRAALALGVTIGAENAPGEVVVTGDEPAIRAVLAALPSRRIAVPGAWHGPAMRGAVEELRAALSAVKRSPARSAFVTNRDGSVVRDEASLPDLLAEQIALPIAWTRAMATIAARAPDVWITVGPGAVLRGLIRRSSAGARVLGTEDAGDLARTLTALLGAP